MEDYVTFEQAVKLKELGFDWVATHFYDLEEPQEGCIKGEVPQDFNVMAFVSLASAPTLAQVQKWLKEKHYLSIEIYTSLDIDSNWEWNGFVKNLNNILEDEIEDTEISCKTYEEALSKCIDKALEILTMKNKNITKVYLVEEQSCVYGDCTQNLIGVFSSLEKAQDAYNNAIFEAEESFKPDKSWYKEENTQSINKYFEMMNDIDASEIYYTLQLEEKPLQ